MLINEFDNAWPPKSVIDRILFRLIFLDIEMAPVFDGFDLLESLITKPQVILIPVNPNHAMKAFQTYSYGLFAETFWIKSRFDVSM